MGAGTWTEEGAGRSKGKETSRSRRRGGGHCSWEGRGDGRRSPRPEQGGHQAAAQGARAVSPTREVPVAFSLAPARAVTDGTEGREYGCCGQEGGEDGADAMVRREWRG